MRTRLWLMVSQTLLLSACAGATIPVAVITKTGHTFRGTVTGSFPTTFKVSDGILSCSGELPLLSSKDTVSYTVAIACSDARKGIAIITPESAISGGGTLRLSDGTEGTFIYGDGAARL